MRKIALFFLVAAIPYATACGMFTGVDSSGVMGSGDGGSDSDDSGRRDSGSHRDSGAHTDGGGGGGGGGGGDDSGTTDFDSGSTDFDSGTVTADCTTLEACCLTLSDITCLFTAQAGDNVACAELYATYQGNGTCP